MAHSGGVTAPRAGRTIGGVSDYLRKSRSEKVITAVEGDDEFSFASVDPEVQARQRQLRIQVDGPVKTKSTQDERTIWRLFRKIFT